MGLTSGTSCGRKEAAMDPNEEVTRRRLTRNLLNAIERVRADVAVVEFWANALTAFSQPAARYESKNVTVWGPGEQVTTLKRRDN
jgi:hypothetical protein